MSGDQDVLDAGASGFLASNHATSRILSQNGFQRSKMEEIKRRLQVLEDEAEVLRGVFLESLEGRAKLMEEIYEMFENIQNCLMLNQQQRDDRCSNGDQIISPLLGKRSGLLQVLRQEPNPSLVNRDLKAKVLSAHLSAQDLPAMRSRTITLSRKSSTSSAPCPKQSALK